MKRKEAEDTIPIMPVQTGDEVKKAGKQGQIIEVGDDAFVMWKDGSMTKEDPYKLVKDENPFVEYLRKVGRI